MLTELLSKTLSITASSAYSFDPLNLWFTKQYRKILDWHFKIDKQHFRMTSTLVQLSSDSVRVHLGIIYFNFSVMFG